MYTIYLQDKEPHRSPLRQEQPRHGGASIKLAAPVLSAAAL